MPSLLRLVKTTALSDISDTDGKAFRSNPIGNRHLPYNGVRGRSG